MHNPILLRRINLQQNEDHRLIDEFDLYFDHVRSNEH